MNTSIDDLEDIEEAWRMASKELGIRATVPFLLNAGIASYKCIAFLPDFGGPKGMLISVFSPPRLGINQALQHEATRTGLYVSFLNVRSYCAFDVSTFREALVDWGFFGDPKLKPDWIDEPQKPVG